MDTLFNKRRGERMGKVLTLIGIFLALFLLMKFLNETRIFNDNTGDITKASTIDVSGEGTAFAVPNIANESFTVDQKAPTIAAAQGVVSGKVGAIVTFLKNNGIAEKDIQTTNYSANPEYSYPTPCYGQACPLKQNAPTLLDYDVAETISVKIRDTEKIGTIVDGLGSLGATQLSGPNYTIDDASAVNAEARAKAIADAKAKADILAKQLGVELVRIVRFSENGGGNYPTPLFAKDMVVGAGASTSVLPVGQNKFTSDVTITYEIR